MILGIDQVDLNSVVIGFATLSLAVNGYFIKRTVDCLDAIEKTQTADGNRLTALETHVFGFPQRRSEDNHHRSGPHPQPEGA